MGKKTATGYGSALSPSSGMNAVGLMVNYSNVPSRPSAYPREHPPADPLISIAEEVSIAEEDEMGVDYSGTEDSWKEC